MAKKNKEITQIMKKHKLISGLKSRYVWGNLLAMCGVIVLLFVAVVVGLRIYTHHGESVKVPDFGGMTYERAIDRADLEGLSIEVADSGYNKKIADKAVLAQMPEPGSMVKKGHVVYITINTHNSPMVALPDLVDNSSYREAGAKLKALGFTLSTPKYIMGEKDWVYGILSNGKHVSMGDMVPTDVPLTLVIGQGIYDDEMSADFGDFDGDIDGDPFEDHSLGNNSDIDGDNIYN